MLSGAGAECTAASDRVRTIATRALESSGDGGRALDKVGWLQAKTYATAFRGCFVKCASKVLSGPSDIL